ncbi:MAG: recombinase family protein [Bifidobacteriaceae bacterium]|jgi:DNA invertase Pin-like site-specific DNA recombinase|nr:recombinase family protein [Bifidobacteriaceae bacterium]
MRDSSAGGGSEQVVVYLRISEDRTGAEAGVERQRQDCLALCRRLGVADPAVFADNDVSAYGNKRRPGYLELLGRARLGPTRIVAWHVDRLYRKPRELEDLIDLVESHPIRIETVKGGGFDLNAHEGRLMARQLVAIASYESGHKADRIRRANRQKAERGDGHGGARYGYGAGGVLVPGEAAVVREMADRFLAGQLVRQITIWLNRDGGPEPPSKGKSVLNVWHASTVKSILCSARISGQRAYDPDAPRCGGGTPAGRAILGPGRWEPIIAPEETERIRAVFANPDRRVGKSAKSLLAGIVACGKCGNTLVTGGWRSGQTAPSKQHFYRCLPLPGRPERGGLSASAAGVEAVVSEAIIKRLAATALPDVAPGGEGGVSQAMARITEARQRMEDMARDWGAGLLTRAELHAARTAAQQAVADAERLLGQTSKSAALKGIPIGDEQALRRAWESEWPIPQKRAIVAALVDTLIVKPLPNGGARFRPERVQITFKA